jgi:hypothetical protein
MKRFIILLSLILIGIPAFSEQILLTDYERQSIELPVPNIRQKQSLLVNDEEVLRELVNRQKEKDIEDIENL